MQADRFTVKSQEALSAAQRLAGARRNPEVVPYHLLVALLEQEGGIVDPVLRAANVDPERVRAQANEKLDALPKVTGEDSAAPPKGRGRGLARAPRGPRAHRAGRRRRRGGARDGRRVRLPRAPAARPGRRSR